MDDIELHNGVVPKYHEMENRDLAKEEEIRYEQCSNTLIEIEMGAEQGLTMLREAVEKEMQQAKDMNWIN